MPIASETLVTKQEFPILLEKEFEHLLHIPTIRYQLKGMMVETFAEKTDLQAILERIDAQGERIEEQGKRIEEQGKRIEEQGERIEALRKDFNRQFAEHTKRMDHFAEVLAEHSKRLDALREDFNRGFNLLSGRIDALEEKMDRGFRRVDTHLSAIGARWGIESESAFRAGLTDILAHETNLRVINYLEMDTAGIVFGRPDQVEIDVVVQDGEHTLIEIKSSVSRSDVYTFARKVEFYEQKEEVKVNRKLIISPMFDVRARELADELGMTVFSSAYDVKRSDL